MSRNNLYTIVVTEYQELQQWKVELHKAASNEPIGSAVFSARLSMADKLPDFIQARMNMVDMGHDVNARARITDGIGSRYVLPADAAEGGAGERSGRVTQYFLHDVTEEQAKDAGLLQDHKLYGKRAKGTIVDDIAPRSGVP